MPDSINQDGEPRLLSSDALHEYRQWLIAAEQKSQEAYDKTVLSLSGGALGISFVFLKDVIHDVPLAHAEYLLGAWLSWGLSSTSILISFFLSHLALRRAINQIDSDEINTTSPGGIYSKVTAAANIAGALLFLIGVLLITGFAGENL